MDERGLLAVGYPCVGGGSPLTGDLARPLALTRRQETSGLARRGESLTPSSPVSLALRDSLPLLALKKK